MNHLPLPHDAAIQNFSIPMLVESLEDHGDFEDFPKRHGWTLTVRNRTTEFQYNQQVISDETRICQFLQTWLYFGLLRDFGINVDLVVFRKPTGHAANELTSACLSEQIPARMQSMRQEVKDLSRSSLKDFADGLQGSLQITWTNLRWLIPSAGRSLSSICLSIAALAEGLGTMLKLVLEERSLPLTVSVAWRIQPEYDFGRPLLDIMKQKGWCSHRLAHLDRDGDDSITRLWYLANIRPPLHDENHGACSSESCKHLQIDPTTYSTVHSSRKCECEFDGPNLQRLAAIVGAARIPLVHLGSGSAQIVEASADTHFVAISHVWADGMGNQTDNVLPSCILREIQKCVNAVMCKGDTEETNFPFWIDTLCLPRRPIELRRKGIANLSEAFKRASVVLVMDTYLRELDSLALSPTEVIARIAVSNWTMRLWTFSEGRLARHIWFQLRDRAVEPLALVSGIETEIGILPGSPSDSLLVEILRMYNATTTTSTSNTTDLASLRSSLKTRSTSWLSDEALCLGYILDLDMIPLVEAEDSKKMQTFWSMMRPLPLGVAFSDTKNKIQTQGYRWAPASLMGNLEAEDWLGPARLNNLFAVSSPAGLKVRLPTLFFNDEVQGPSHLQARRRLTDRFRPPTELLGPLEFKHKNGSWYHCVIEGPWHQTPAPQNLFEYSKFSIMLASGLYYDDKQYPSQRGLLVTTHDQRADTLELPISAKVHFHVTINLCTDLENQYMELLKSQAVQVDAAHANQLEDLLDDREATLNFVWLEWIEKKVVYDRELLTLAKLVHQQRGMGDDLLALMIYCNDYIVWFLRIGEWYHIWDGRNTTQRCID